MPGPPGPAGNSKIGLIFALLVLYSMGLGRVGGVTRMLPLLFNLQRYYNSLLGMTCRLLVGFRGKLDI